MKKTYFYFVGITLAVLMAGCGKNGSKSSPAAAVPVGTVGICGAGLVNTQHGCLQQGSCPIGQAQFNNGQCIPAMASQCGGGLVYSSQVGTCLPQGSCPIGQAQYNNTCVMADGGINGGYNSGYNPGYNTGYFPGYPVGHNPGYNGGYQGGISGGISGGIHVQGHAGHNPYIPQQQYPAYNVNPMYNPFVNPYWNPQQYFYYGM